MNTSDSYAAPAPRIGLIELPDLAAALAGCGLQVVTAPDFRGGVAAVKESFATAGAFPVIVADRPIAGLRAWVERIQLIAQVPVAVVRDGAEPAVVSDTIIELHLPTTVNAILAAVNLAPVGAAGDAPFPVASAAPAGIDLGDFTFDEPAHAPAPVATPAPVAPVAAVPAPSPAEDPFGFNEPAPAAAPAPAADPFDPFAAVETGPAFGGGFSFNPAPPEQDWTQAAAAAPAPVAPAPAADAFSWDTVAAQAPTAPAPAPVQAAPALVPVTEASIGWDTQAPAVQGWDTVAAQAPVAPAPAPVQAAPETSIGWDTPAPAVQGWDTVAAQAPVAPAPAPSHLAPVPEASIGWDTPAPVQAAPVMGWNTAAQPAAQPAAEWPVPAPAPVPAPFQVHAPQDASSVFDGFEAAKLHGTGRSAAGQATLLISWAGKGGVGKSTTGLQLAELCAEAGLRTVLIDGNSGQGDLSTYLRINKSDLPTIYSAAQGSISAAVLSPDSINAVRGQGLNPVKFGFVSAPPEDIEDGHIVTNDTYRAVIDYCRRSADVVILDTQIIESIDRTGVLSELLVPAWVQDAWGIGVADMTPVGVNNLNARLRKFASMGVAPDRQMLFVNKVPEVQLADAAKLDAYFRGKATFLGSVADDAGIRDNMNAGRTEVTNPQMRAALSSALFRATGNEEFRRMSEAPAPERAVPVKSAKVGFWGRMTGKKAAA